MAMKKKIDKILSGNLYKKYEVATSKK